MRNFTRRRSASVAHEALRLRARCRRSSRVFGAADRSAPFERFGLELHPAYSSRSCILSMSNLVFSRGPPHVITLSRKFDPPNKAPEPPAGSVSPHAFARPIELKLKNANRDAARGAPAPAVAHL